MRVGVLVNRVEELEQRQTTTRLLFDFAQRYGVAWVFGVNDFELTRNGEILAAAREIVAHQAGFLPDTEGIGRGSRRCFVLDGLDALLIRTNPGRDRGESAAHATAMNFASSLAGRGVFVLNDPDGLRRAASKLYPALLAPGASPPTMVSRSVEGIRRFVCALNGPAVIKPLSGTRGQDVFLPRPSHGGNLRQITEVVLRQGYAMVQGFVAEAVDGDMRVLVVDGRILEVDGRTCAYCRMPRSGDFRSNLHTGGRAARAIVSREVREVVEIVGPRLIRDGLFLVGLDIIGTKIIEMNVFSPGGLNVSERLEGVNFSSAVLDAIESRYQAWRRHRPSDEGKGGGHRDG